jgi:hypothetical protein
VYFTLLELKSNVRKGNYAGEAFGNVSHDEQFAIAAHILRFLVEIASDMALGAVPMPRRVEVNVRCLRASQASRSYLLLRQVGRVRHEPELELPVAGSIIFI